MPQLGQLIRRVLGRSQPDDEVFRPDPERDIFLVSYPRSGNTWMRTIFAEALHGGQVPDLSAIDFLVPDSHVLPLQKNVPALDRYAVKSHLPLQLQLESRHYRHVLYLVRDPRDVVLSHHRYVCNLRGYTGSIVDFTADWVRGRIWPCSWHEHVASWLGPGSQRMGAQTHIVKYEELLSDPFHVLDAAFRNFELSIPNDRIEEIIISTRADEMRHRERKGTRPDATADGYQFIGKARSNQWVDDLPSEALDIVLDFAGEAMMAIGYIG
jgi:hypothetical protein